MALDSDALESALRKWAERLLGETMPPELQAIAMVGKTLCSTLASHGRSVHVLSLLALRVGPRGSQLSQLQTVERALARQRLTPVARIRSLFAGHVPLADQRRQRRIGPELIVVVQVLVAQRQGEHPLLEEILDSMFHEFRIAEIIETAAYVGQQACLGPNLPLQPPAPVRSNSPPSKPTVTRRAPSGSGNRTLAGYTV